MWHYVSMPFTRFTLRALLYEKLTQTLVVCAALHALVYNIYVPAIIICIYFVIMFSKQLCIATFGVYRLIEIDEIDV